MAKRLMVLALVLASFAATAPAAVVYGRGYYGRPVARYYYGPRVYVAPAVPYVVPYVAPVYPAYGYGYGYRTYGYGYRGYAPRYYGGYRGYRR